MEKKLYVLALVLLASLCFVQAGIYSDCSIYGNCPKTSSTSTSTTTIINNTNASGISWAEATNGTLYQSTNPFSFYNSTTIGNIPNTNNYWNTTFANFNKTYADTLYCTINEPLWTGNQSSYYNKTQIDALIPSFLTYYFWDITSTYNSTFSVMNTTQNPTTTNKTATGLVDGEVIVFRLNDNTNLTGLNGGALHLHTTATKTGGIKDLQIVGKLSKLYYNGTIGLLATTDTSTILVTDQLTNINLFASVPAQSLNVTDRLLWRLEAVVTGSGTAPSVNITVGGTTNNGLDLPVSSSNIIFTETDPYWSDNFTKYNSSWSSITNTSYVLNTGDLVSGSYRFNQSSIALQKNSLPTATTTFLSLNSSSSFGASASSIDWYNINEAELMGRISFEPGSGYDNPLFRIVVSNGGSNLSTRFVITNNGTVGINTTTPSNTLDVRGLINSSEGYIVNSSLGFTGTCTILGLTSITVKGGIITGCA